MTLHVGRSTWLLRQTLKTFETRLDPARFLRIRRSVMVSVDGIVRPEAHGEHTVRLRHGTELASTRTHARAIRTFLARLE